MAVEVGETDFPVTAIWGGWYDIGDFRAEAEGEGERTGESTGDGWRLCRTFPGGLQTMFASIGDGVERGGGVRLPCSSFCFSQIAKACSASIFLVWSWLSAVFKRSFSARLFSTAFCLRRSSFFDFLDITIESSYLQQNGERVMMSSSSSVNNCIINQHDIRQEFDFIGNPKFACVLVTQHN